MNLGPGHIHGMCLINYDNKIIFLLIPKNAQSTLSGYLLGKHFKHKNYFELNNYEKKFYTFCIFRNPLERFISASNTIAKRNILKLENYNNNNIKNCIDNMLDEHFVHQHKFIENIRIDYILPFEKIKNFNLSIQNKSEYNSKQEDFLKNIDKENIKNIYNKDYEIHINSLNKEENFNNFLNKINIPNLLLDRN